MPGEVDNEVAELAEKVYGNPATQMDFLRLAKKADPSLHIPVVESEAAIELATAPLLKKIEALEAKSQQDSSLANLTKQRDALRAKGATDEDIQRVEKFMVENKVGTHDLAYRLVKENETPSPPSPARGTTVATMPELSKEFLANPAQGARSLASQIISDMAKQRK